MIAMTSKLNGLFSIGEDFDDEDLLGTAWAGPTVSGPANVAAAVASCALRASSAAHTEQEKKSLRQTGESSTALRNGTGSGNSMQTAVGQTVALGLRQPSSSTQLRSLHAPLLNNAQTNLASEQSRCDTEGPQKACVAQDDFDDWDVDLADLDACDPQMGVGGHFPQPAQPPAPFPVAPTVEAGSSAKRLQPPTCGGTPTLPGRGLRELSTPCQATGPSTHKLPPPTSTSTPFRSPAPRPALLSAPPHSPGVFPGLTAASPISSPFPRPIRGPQQPQRQCSTPAPSPEGRSLFGSISPAPSSVSCPGLSPRPLHTPVFTNHLVQLVSASSKLPRKRPHSTPQQPRTRRFPGPAGLLPKQPQGQSLDDIVVSVPQTPAHGAVARLPSQPPSSQTEEDEFSGGPWAAMKAEMGLDERNPSCFLHSYSVVMVLRKAALKQLAKNKVPNMAVQLKSIVHTHADAKAVFKDPTGEIQGTVHRRLLEDRLGELKAGAVLLLKQVGVFSPSHRNHYLNVTPNNLLRIYPPDGVSLSSTQLPPLSLEPVLESPSRSPSSPVGPVSQMQLVFDEEEEEDEEWEGEKCREAGQAEQVPSGSRASSTETPAPQDQGWDADDDLDELLGELPEESYCL